MARTKQMKRGRDESASSASTEPLEMAESVTAHRYGVVASDMTIIMDDFPTHFFYVHQAVLALHSDYFTTVVSRLQEEQGNVTHIPAGSNSSVAALDCCP